MSISDLYSRGKHKNSISHFANIVKLALADEKITEGEQTLLDSLAKRLNISEEKAKTIIKNPDGYPINPPVSYDDRIERLFNLTKMIFADDNVAKDQVTILHRIAAGLGFPTDNVEKVTDEALHLMMNDNDLDTFIRSIKNVNSI